MVSMTNVLLPLINCQHIKSFSKTFQAINHCNKPWLEPLFCKSYTVLEAFCETIKAADTGIKQLNFINMLKDTYINVSNTVFPKVWPMGWMWPASTPRNV